MSNVNPKSKSKGRTSGRGRNKQRYGKGKEPAINKNSGNTSSDRGYSDVDSQHNDPAWYNKFPELVHVATNLSWQYALGAPITIDAYQNTETMPPGSVNASNSLCIDTGIRKIGYVPSYGVGSDVNSPVNKAAIELYSIIRKNKSGNPGFDSADVMKMLIAMDSVYQYIGLLQRLYGCLNISSAVNNYIPRALVHAMGFDWDDLLAHKADLNFFINTFVVQAAKINVPIGMTVFDRHYFLCTNVFKDEDVDRASLFFFQPDYLYKYNWSTGDLDAISWYSASHAFENLVSFGWDLLNSLQRVDDFYTMNSNILLAYQDVGFHRLSALDPTYATIPIFRTEMLVQMHNITPVGVNFYGNSLAITEDKLEQSPNKGALVFKPITTHAYGPATFDQLIDIPFDNPSVDDIMEATRCKCIGQAINVGTDTPNWCTELTSTGTEIVTEVTDWSFGYKTDDYGQRVYAADPYKVIDFRGYVAASAVYTAMKINMSPLLATITKENELYKVTSFIGDVTNYAVVNNDNLYNMHMAALLSQLTISRDNLNRFLELRSGK